MLFKGDLEWALEEVEFGVDIINEDFCEMVRKWCEVAFQEEKKNEIPVVDKVELVEVPGVRDVDRRELFTVPETECVETVPEDLHEDTMQCEIEDLLSRQTELYEFLDVDKERLHEEIERCEFLEVGEDEQCEILVVDEEKYEVPSENEEDKFEVRDVTGGEQDVVDEEDRTEESVPVWMSCGPGPWWPVPAEESTKNENEQYKDRTEESVPTWTSCGPGPWWLVPAEESAENKNELSEEKIESLVVFAGGEVVNSEKFKSLVVFAGGEVVNSEEFKSSLCCMLDNGENDPNPKLVDNLSVSRVSCETWTVTAEECQHQKGLVRPRKNIFIEIIALTQKCHYIFLNVI
jgi:hypothetical protein